MDKAKFAMAFHCYQPSFNFDSEIERAYDLAYLPLIETLKAFPEIKTSFHFSGNIIEWIEERHPEYVASVRALVASGSMEIINGAYSEPIMTVIPEHDRHGQLRLNREIAENVFGARTSGSWIPERVWDPSLIGVLSEEGMRYAIVDDCHLTRAGVRGRTLHGPCRVKNEQGSLVLFPGSSYLRYAIPFMAPEKTISYFREKADIYGEKGLCFFFADDGEKMGAWPHTYRHVHRKKWLYRFFESLIDNSDWLKTVTYSDVLKATPAAGVNTVPPASYSEMMSWSGGDFNNFFSKYPESDRMRERMLGVSNSIQEARPFLTEKTLVCAKKELFKAQSNCAYWHGAFGGVYLPHLRSGVYRHLLKAQDIIDNATFSRNVPVRFLEYQDMPMGKEAVISNELVSAYMSPAKGGALCELDYKRLKMNLLNTIARRRETYHRKLEEGYAAKIREARRSVKNGEPADIHDILGLSEKGLKRFLKYDDYQRNSFLTHVFTGRIPWEDMNGQRTSSDSFLKGAYSSVSEAGRGKIKYTLSRRDTMFSPVGSGHDVEITKSIEMSDNPVIFFSQKLRDKSDTGERVNMAVEFNLMVFDRNFASRPRMVRGRGVSFRDMYAGVEVDFNFDDQYNTLIYPFYSVNETERGLRKTFQGLSVVIARDPGASFLKNKEDVLQFSMTIR